MIDFVIELKKQKNLQNSDDYSIFDNLYNEVIEKKEFSENEDLQKNLKDIFSNLILLNVDINVYTAVLIYEYHSHTELVLDPKLHLNNDSQNIYNGLKSLEVMPSVNDDVHLEKKHREMFIILAKDIRVILIKLVYRLNFLKKIKHLNNPDSFYIANETLKIYVPIAHRLGLGTIKSELEDLSLYFIDVDGYLEIAKSIKIKKEKRDIIIKEMIGQIQLALIDYNNIEIFGRSKNIYSIYKKINTKNKNFNDIYDLQAIRIICNTDLECYNILGVIHQHFTPIGNRFKDYIALPKENLYQSLHTSILGIEGLPFEVQIRTKKMDDISETGVAAHWDYKEKSNGDIDSSKDHIEKKLHFFRNLFQDTNTTDADYLNEIKEEVFYNNIFTITPNGNVIHLPKDATVIDFGYKVHSTVGASMIGAKVNNMMVPFNTPLQTGDIVEIITKKNAPGPNESWLEYAKTSQAKNKIRSFLKKKKMHIDQEKLCGGRNIILFLLKENNIDSKILDDQKLVRKIYVKLGYTDYSKLLTSFYENKKSAKIFVSELKNEIHYAEKKSNDVKITSINEKNSTDEIIVSGADNILKILAKCCTPVKGDQISAVINSGKSITIHRDICPNISKVSKGKILEANWNNNIVKTKYLTNISILSLNTSSIITEVAAILSNSNVGVLSFKSDKKEDNIKFNIKISIFEEQQIKVVFANFNKLSSIISYKREIN